MKYYQPSNYGIATLGYMRQFCPDRKHYLRTPMLSNSADVRFIYLGYFDHLTSLLLPKMSSQCYSNGSGSLCYLSSNKETHPHETVLNF